MNYNIVNMGEIKGKDNKTFYCLDIVISSKNTTIKRVFIKKETYEKLLILFKDRLDMLTFNIEDYVIIEPNYKGEFELKIFEEHILAI